MSTTTVYNEHIFAIAHELRSPLAVINSNTFTQISLLRSLYYNIEHNEKNIELIKKLKECILQIETQVDNIEEFIEIVSDHGLYNNGPTEQKFLIHMKSYMDHVLNASPTFSRSMAIFGTEGIEYGDGDGEDFENVHIIVNPQDLNRIIMNICSNAADAVTKLWKERKRYTSNYFPSLKFRCLKSAAPTQAIVMRDEIMGPFGCSNTECSFFLVIEDNGPGIAQEHIEHIFTHGFSTKKESFNSNHLGFGLHLCMQLAKKNNLSLFIETGPTGTKFFIGFPEMIISEPGKLQDRVLVKTVNTEIYDYSLLNFSEDSIKLYRDTIKSVGHCSDAYKVIKKENVNSDHAIHVFDPKRKKNC
jgi:signal transduction histidine kinase